jgi:hypothetical protein
MVEKAFRENQPQISEHTFTNLFVWRGSKEVFLSQLDDFLLVRRKHRGKYFLFPPIGWRSLSSVVEELKSLAGGETLEFYGLTSAQAEELRRKGFQITSSRADWDYVYLVSDLVNLPGPRFYSKRKEIQKCLSNHKCEYKALTSEILSDCLSLQTRWCNVKHCEAEPGLTGEN